MKPTLSLITSLLLAPLAALHADELKVPPTSKEPRAAYGKAPFDDPVKLPISPKTEAK